MAWMQYKGREYTTALTAEYWVNIETESMMYEAEDRAWELLESVLKNSEANKVEVYSIADEYKNLLGYSFKFRVNYEVYAVATDSTQAYNESVSLIENIKLPSNISYVGCEQRNFLEVGEPVYMVHGDRV